MISVYTKLTVADNSGARLLRCIRVLGGTRRRVANVGDVIVVSVRSAIPHSNVKEGSVMRALIVRVKKEAAADGGSYLRFGSNAAVLLNKQNELVGTRIFGAVSRNLRFSKVDKTVVGKVMALAQEAF